MPIIALVNQKGGTGKTTAAVHLASWLSREGSVLLVDADAQQSSSIWVKSLISPMPNVVENDPEKLFEILPEFSSRYDFVVIDGPGSLSEITKAILTRCDLALVPCQPSGLDLHSSNKILRFINHAQEIRGGKPNAALFLSRATPRTTLLRESIEVLKSQNIPLLDGIIYQRQCIADAPTQNSTVFQLVSPAARVACTDYQILFNEVLELLCLPVAMR
ncbi:hypothetical protein C7H19_18310 [Aphanothece hegewaldii CCALA 016]|uniref:CobQ/CobB/MinD/ParA nucleotide binding domain-containing protein n=1 Tax=Aphanothece hegewaldii CCALA 016 TaxID=2107694 RepID=A0A2T1LUG5_9CHRO|nr:ParA family protein [Aphanothece hegewaldii]PSF34959.1 hypothetical protein C7H19_18310 [Aphanothece hegewaldii CCALA 016]